MASSSGDRTDPPPPSVDELRGALASKGLVIKDSILARLAKSKSLKGICSPPPQLPSDPETQAAPDLAQDEESRFERRLNALISQTQPQENGSDHVPDGVSKSSTVLIEETPLIVPSKESKVLAVNNEAVHQNSDDEDKKRRRSERFGVVSEDEKLKLRAARFGAVNDDEKLEADKKKARAARFGIVDEDTKKKARIERFGKTLVQEDPIEMEKRKARAARFAIATQES